MEMPLSRYRAPLLTALPVLACLLLTATHAVAQPDLPPVDTAQSEIEQLIDVLEGRWKTHVFYEPNPQMPDGGTSVGWEESHAGPGRASVIIETESHGASGSFEGAGFVTWDVAHSRYNLHWLLHRAMERRQRRLRRVRVRRRESISLSAQRHGNQRRRVCIHDRHGFDAGSFDADRDHPLHARLTICP
jgi:hypothetical protein